jgi:hypothetical protein
MLAVGWDCELYIIELTLRGVFASHTVPSREPCSPRPNDLATG